MQIERNVKDLDIEIKELHTYVSLTQDQKQNRNIELLTIIKTIYFAHFHDQFCWVDPASFA